MRLPTYNSQGNVSAGPVYQGVPDRTNNTLSSIVDGLETVKRIKDEEERRSFETQVFQMQTDATIAIEESGQSIIQNIKNGGAYANAEQDYQKSFDKAADGINRIQDESVREKLKAQLRRQGVEYNLRIKSAISERQRSDALSSYANQSDILQNQYIMSADENERKSILQKMASTTALAQNTGLIDKNKGEMAIRRFAADAESQRLQLLAQDNPIAAYEQMEKNKSMLDTQQYISLRGNLISDVKKISEKMGSVERVTSYQEDPYNSPEPKQRDVDRYFGVKLDEIRNSDNPNAAYEFEVIQTARTTGFVPTQERNKAISFLSTYKEGMTDQEIAAAAQSARIVTNVADMGDVVSKGSKFTSDTVSRARIINSRIMAGMDERSAVTSVLSRSLNKNNIELDKAIRKQTVSSLSKGEIQLPFSNKESTAKGVQSDFIEGVTMYMSNSADRDEAIKMAQKDIESRYKKFNGVFVRQPPQSFTVYSEGAWKRAAEAFVQNSGYKIEQGDRVILQSDAQTMREKFAAENDESGKLSVNNDVSFPVMIYRGKDVYIPITDKSGMPVRVKGDPKLMSPQDMVLDAKERYGDAVGGIASEFILRAEANRLKESAKSLKEKADKVLTGAGYSQSDLDYLVSEGERIREKSEQLRIGTEALRGK